MKWTKRILFGAGASVLAYVAALAAASLLVVREMLPETGVAWCVWIGAFLSALVGGSIAAKRETEPLLPLLACGTAFWCAVLLLGLLANDTLVWPRTVTLAIAILAAEAALLAVKRKRGKGRRARRPRRRA